LAGRYDPDVHAMIEYAKDMLMGVQLADSLRPVQMWLYQHREVNKMHSHLLPGRGMIDIKGALTALKEIDYDGPLVLIPYRYGMYPMNFLDLISESKNIVEKLEEGI
jgi:sugar phosphate isomerase/epimerase